MKVNKRSIRLKFTIDGGELTVPNNHHTLTDGECLKWPPSNKKRKAKAVAPRATKKKKTSSQTVTKEIKAIEKAQRLIESKRASEKKREEYLQELNAKRVR